MASRGKERAVGAAAGLVSQLHHPSAAVFKQQLYRDCWEVQRPGHPL